MSRSLFIHASNVHQGGGRSLLAAIIGVLPRRGMTSILSLDARMPLPDDMASEIQIRRVKPSIIQRFSIERWLVNTVASDDVVLCFGNLPPLFKLRGHVVVFVQNRYLIDDLKLDGFPFKIRLRLMAERFWLFNRLVNADEFVVQTPSMKRLLDIRMQGKVSISVLPFIENPDGYMRGLQLTEIPKGKKNDFLYVASGEPHKNHQKLIEAWCLLAADGLFPSLKLTIDRIKFVELCTWIDQKVEQFQLEVDNLGNLPLDHIGQLYQQAEALIYPSTFESFGLPLIEARQAGLFVLASESDYVRDILDPEQTFDPESAISIARSVKRFMDIEEQPLTLKTAGGFIKHILEKMK